MTWQDMALGAAGIVGAGVAVIHGALTQRFIVRPLEAACRAEPGLRGVRRLVPVLMHFSTYAWFLSGVALVVAAGWMAPQARLVTAALVGAGYLFGAVGNFWATRGRHPGWMMMSLALALLIAGAQAPGG
ncbi:MAG: hypothetical protein GC203_18125 [Phenylobacterium sp.]|nr:hypothetical protein [Phenylobacterium sp.]